jgi:hypothetical protein
MFSLLVSWLGLKSEPASLTFTQEASWQERESGSGRLHQGAQAVIKVLQEVVKIAGDHIEKN